MSRSLNAIIIAFAMLAMAGCAGSGVLPSSPPPRVVGSAPVAPTPPPAAQTLYVGNCGGRSITEYPALAANGNVAPSVTIAGSNTQLICPEGMAFDSAGVMYVADCGAKAILEFAVGASGNVAPAREITGFNCPVDVAIDGIGNIIVSDFANTNIEISRAGRKRKRGALPYNRYHRCWIGARRRYTDRHC